MEPVLVQVALQPALLGALTMISLFAMRRARGKRLSTREALGMGFCTGLLSCWVVAWLALAKLGPLIRQLGIFGVMRC